MQHSTDTHDMPTVLPNVSASMDSLVQVERCIAELQRGRAIVLSSNETEYEDQNAALRVIQLVETLQATALDALITEHDCHLVLSQSRARALGLQSVEKAVCLRLDRDATAKSIRNWAGLHPAAPANNNLRTTTLPSEHSTEKAAKALVHSRTQGDIGPFAVAARHLATYAHALPAFIIYEVSSIPTGLLCTSTHSAATYVDQSGKLMKLSSVRIPLATAESVELTVFRERHGNAEHVAITVGQPDFSNTVTVRLHSSCFTGDILGSMKCDCGEQLQTAISSMADGDGGVVLYVSQEGRGIGLASKLLAYQLQHQGMDTIDANQHLGFDADERNYAAAVSMLEQLGIDNIHLMTNNPLKIEAMREHGIAVHDRVPSPATVNVHNARYLETKRTRAGHYSSTETVR